MPRGIPIIREKEKLTRVLQKRWNWIYSIQTTLAIYNVQEDRLRANLRVHGKLKRVGVIPQSFDIHYFSSPFPFERRGTKSGIITAYNEIITKYDPFRPLGYNAYLPNLDYMLAILTTQKAINSKQIRVTTNPLISSSEEE